MRATTPENDTACQLVVVTLPGGEQVSVRFWSASGRVEVDHRFRDGVGVWCPINLEGGTFRVEVVA